MTYVSARKEVGSTHSAALDPSFGAAMATNFTSG